MTLTTARPNYFEGQVLQASDFSAEQGYHMEMRAAFNRSLHIWGVASGLAVSWQQAAQSRELRVSPGMAIDRLGREIILTSTSVVDLSDAEAGAVYYLTIRYREVYADFVSEPEVRGYKRIVQQPEIGCARSPPDPGLAIPLAVVSLSSAGVINDLSDRAGAYERRYVGGRFGRLELAIAGSGIGDDKDAEAPVGTLAISAQLAEDGAYLAFEAARSRFSGALSIAGTLRVDQSISAQGNIAAQGRLSGASLTTAGVTVAEDGSVSLLGSYSGGDLSTTPTTFKASTDGFVITQAQAGTDKVFGYITCTTDALGMTLTCGTKECSDYSLPQATSMMTPVKKDEQVTLSLTGADGFGLPTGRYIWVPLGLPNLGAKPDAPIEAVPGPFELLPDPDALRRRLARDPADTLHGIAGKASPQE